MSTLEKICIAEGDGIGPEIVEATMMILNAAHARISSKKINMGEQVYLEGFSSGISPEAWEALNHHKILLKAPITTPQGKGYKSLNVTLRKTLGLYANVRPCKAYSPFVKTHFPKLDMVIIRENEEDVYAGIEHQQTLEVIQCLKLISVPGCERIIRYAFNYARQNGRKKITCMSKDNIMKLTDGLFHKIFNEISKEYPDIESEHLIVDIGAALLATNPERFDVIVTLNLYGDILSDIAAQLTGSVGLAGSSNIGQDFALFEAIHGSAPDIAGKNIANPSGLIQASVQMLDYMGQHDIAHKINTAWFNTLKDGVHTRDIFSEALTEKLVGTMEFAEAVCKRLNNVSSTHDFSKIKMSPIPEKNIIKTEIIKKDLVGVDVFLCEKNPNINALAETLIRCAGNQFDLKLITNRGVKVWPEGSERTLCTDHWRCRFKFSDVEKTQAEIRTLLFNLEKNGLEWIKLENLYDFDGKPGFSLGQGE